MNFNWISQGKDVTTMPECICKVFGYPLEKHVKLIVTIGVSLSLLLSVYALFETTNEIRLYFTYILTRRGGLLPITLILYYQYMNTYRVSYNVLATMLFVFMFHKYFLYSYYFLQFIVVIFVTYSLVIAYAEHVGYGK